MRFRYSLGLTFVTGLVLLCGCNNNHLRAPSTLIYTTPAAVYTKGVQIASNTPTASGGAVASYSVTPALPAG